MFCVYRLIPTEVVESAVRSAVADTRISDSAVNAALRRMMDWLVWPTCRNLDQWIICFLKELAITKKFSILISVTESKVEQVRKRGALRPQKPVRFIWDGEFGGSGFLYPTPTHYTVTTRMTLH